MSKFVTLVIKKPLLIAIFYIFTELNRSFCLILPHRITLFPQFKRSAGPHFIAIFATVKHCPCKKWCVRSSEIRLVDAENINYIALR